MHPRRTSVYTVRLTDQALSARQTFDLTGTIRENLRAACTDHGDRSVSFRVTDDETAAQVAREAATGLTTPWELTTGLGVHRRTIPVP